MFLRRSSANTQQYLVVSNMVTTSENEAKLQEWIKIIIKLTKHIDDEEEERRNVFFVHNKLFLVRYTFFYLICFAHRAPESRVLWSPNFLLAAEKYLKWQNEQIETVRMRCVCVQRRQHEDTLVLLVCSLIHFLQQQHHTENASMHAGDGQIKITWKKYHFISFVQIN